MCVKIVNDFMHRKHRAFDISVAIRNDFNAYMDGWMDEINEMDRALGHLYAHIG